MVASEFGVKTRISQLGDDAASHSTEIWVIPVDESVILAEEAQAVLSTQTRPIGD